MALDPLVTPSSAGHTFFARFCHCSSADSMDSGHLAWRHKEKVAAALRAKGLVAALRAKVLGKSSRCGDCSWGCAWVMHGAVHSCPEGHGTGSCSEDPSPEQIKVFYAGLCMGLCMDYLADLAKPFEHKQELICSNAVDNYPLTVCLYPKQAAMISRQINKSVWMW